MLTIAFIFANGVAVFTYVATNAAQKQTRMTGNTICDFFMGAILNPRIGRVDLKMFSETRVSWILLFFLTVSAAAKQYDLYCKVT